MGKVRVYELARELGVESKEVLKVLIDLGEGPVRSASATIEPHAVRRVAALFTGSSPDATGGVPRSGYEASVVPRVKASASPTPHGNATRLVSPDEFVATGRRLFIDTNVFMDIDPTRDGLKRLFERCVETIRSSENGVVVPSKVVDELRKQSQIDTTGLSLDPPTLIRR